MKALLISILLLGAQAHASNAFETLRQVLNGAPWRRMNIYGRTDADMLLFYVEVSDYYGYQAPMYPRVYGYCWNDAPVAPAPAPVPAPGPAPQPKPAPAPPGAEQPLP